MKRSRSGTTSMSFSLASIATHIILLLTFLPTVIANTADDSIDFPPQLDSDDISYFSSSYDIDNLHWALSNVFRRSERNTNAHEIVHTLPPVIVSRGGGSTYSTAYKLQLDIEQAEYLADNLEDKNKAAFFRKEVIPTYQSVLRRVPPLDRLEATGGLYAFKQEDVQGGIQSVYNKALHVTEFDELKDENGRALPLLHPNFNAGKIQQQWFGETLGHELTEGEKLSQPGIVVIDDILSPEALRRIRQLLLESTVWYQTKMPKKFGGYVGAYIDDGLHDRILLALAFELNKALPRIMEGHPLKYLWAYKYDSDYTGINTHADQAAVNVNLWITPEDANLDKESGGLVIFTAKPPDDWDFEQYNTNTERVMEELIAPTNYANVTVPYKENRAVMFDSALFHHTDKFRFKKGYENRRINLTILYGEMKKNVDAGSARQDL